MILNLVFRLAESTLQPCALHKIWCSFLINGMEIFFVVLGVYHAKETHSPTVDPVLVNCVVPVNIQVLLIIFKAVNLKVSVMCETYFSIREVTLIKKSYLVNML